MKQLTCIFALLAGLLASCGTDGRGVPETSLEPGSGDRLCTHMGGFDSFVCRYNLEELAGIEEDAAVQTRGFLQEDSNGLYLASDLSGGGAIIRLGELHGDAAEKWFAEAMLGHLTSVRGIYRPATQVIDVRSMRWVEEAGVPSPEFRPDGVQD